jgi:uncharacterized membrane protein
MCNCFMRLLLLCLTLFAGICVGAGAAIFGGNLVVNPGFETLGGNGLPADWSLSENPKGAATFAVDANVVLSGTKALRIELPDTSSAEARSAAFAVTPGQSYLFSVGFRSTGFGQPGKYCGVDAYVTLIWFDAAGKQVARGGTLGFPYQPSDWDLRDNFVTPPPDAAQVMISACIHNHSKQTWGTNIPSVLWLDGLQFRAYTPPPTPEWAKKPPERIVEGGWDTSRVIMPALGGLNNAGGKWSSIFPDPQSTWGTVLQSPVGVERGLMCHSPYYMNARPGLYRLTMRCKVPDIAGTVAVGGVDVDSQYAAGRAYRMVAPAEFRAADTYQEFDLDFVLRTQGYWDFRVYTEGKAAFTVDTVKVFPVQYFTDAELLDIYPGSDGVVPATLRPAKGGAFTTLLLAGMQYEEMRILDALRLTGYDAKTETVWVQKMNAQAFPGFPETPEKLFTHNLLVFCDVDATSFTLRQKRMIVEYVKRGGGLLILGGHKSFERGGIRDSLFEELLPVTCAGGDLPPLKHSPAGALLTKGADHPLNAYLDLSAQPACYYQHLFTPRPGAVTVLAAGDAPAVVAGRYGQGRVACVGLTCLGDPPEGQTPFWTWSAWTMFLRDLVWWTAGEDGHF